jgi:sec-independent protein translocase protein TatA
MGIPHGQELIIILIIILLLFGAKKLPELGKSLGLGIKEFKKTTKELTKGDDEESAKPKAESSDA